jgi:hypothetical protein
MDDRRTAKCNISRMHRNSPIIGLLDKGLSNKIVLCIPANLQGSHSKTRWMNVPPPKRLKHTRQEFVHKHVQQSFAPRSCQRYMKLAPQP